jgi:hypothetical protein
MKTPLAALISLSLAIPLCACSYEQLYRTGQAWQTNECYKIADRQEQSRCHSSASTSYEQYKRETRDTPQGR